MSSSLDRRERRVAADHLPVRQRVLEIWRYRELLVGLVRKELKVKYKNSVLGFMWSMLNPALYLVVFYLLFTYVLPNGMPYYAIYLLSGLLVWNLFSSALPAATGAIVGNSGLVKKVAFPREILALAAVGASLVHFFLQCLVLIGALAVFRYAPDPAYLLMVIPGLLVLLLFVGALGIMLSAVNVYLRDTAHLLELALLAWFWSTPIVYPFRQVADRLDPHGWTWAYLLNPVTNIVLVFQRAIYNATTPIGKDGTPIPVLPDVGAGWYLGHLAIVGALSLGLFLLALNVFSRLEGNFAEEL